MAYVSAVRNAELEQQILANLDDPGAYLVYADWLQSQGDPLQGELIVLPEDARPAFFAHHAEHFLGPFVRRKPRQIDLEWRHGFIRKATIGWPMWGKDRKQCEQDFDAFLGLGSTRFIEELSIGPVPGQDMMSLDGIASVIDKHAPVALRSLYLGDIDDWDISSTSTSMPSCRAVPNLRTVTLRGGDVTIGEIDHPQLRSFTVESGSLTETQLREIASARWPQLESLSIWFGEPNYGASGEVADVQPILDAIGLSNLTKLGLMNCPFADEIVAALVSSKILPQLKTLDLTMGNLSDAGLGAMLAAKERFEHLEHLELDDNALTNQHWPAARALAKNVTFGTSHDPDRAGSRYCSVGE